MVSIFEKTGTDLLTLPRSLLSFTLYLDLGVGMGCGILIPCLSDAVDAKALILCFAFSLMAVTNHGDIIAKLPRRHLVLSIKER